MSTIEERVAAGAAWLDEARPGWWRYIDLGTIDMADECLCVLGQVFDEASVSSWDEDEDFAPNSGFDYACDVLGAPDVSGGFNVKWFGDGAATSHEERREQFAALGTAWKQLIAARRAA